MKDFFAKARGAAAGIAEELHPHRDRIVMFAWLGVALAGGALFLLTPESSLLALVLPALLRFRPVGLHSSLPSMEWAFAVTAAWFMPMNMVLSLSLPRYFGVPESSLGAMAVALAASTLLTLPTLLAFVVLVVPGAPPLRRWLGMLAALALLTLPPIGLVALRNPLLVAGMLFPGAGWWGVVATAFLLAGIVAWPDGVIARLRARQWWQAAPAALLAIPVLAMVGWWAWWAKDAPERRSEAFRAWYGWAAHDTTQTEIEAAERALGVGQLLLDRSALTVVPGMRAVVFPEAILRWPPRGGDAITVPVLDAKARALGITVLVGAYTDPDPQGRWVNGLYALGAQRGWIDTPRVPVPGAHWRPLVGSGVQGRLLAPDTADVAGQRVGLSVCYEDAILWPHRRLLAGDGSLMVSVGNGWALHPSIAAMQAASARLIARIAGVPLVRAYNAPRGG